MFAVRVTNVRCGPFGKVKAFFSILVGDEDEDGRFSGALRLDDFKLFGTDGEDGTGYCFQGPSKPEMKDGQEVLDEQGCRRYDDLVSLFTVWNGDQRTPTDLAWDTHDMILALAIEYYEEASAERNGRGSGTPSPLPAPAKARTGQVVKATKAAAQPADEEEDDPDDPDYLPF